MSGHQTPDLTDLDQGTREWLEARMGKITASLAAACLGLSPWCSPQKAYRQILGLEVTQSSYWMIHGREFEEVAVQLYEVATGNICTRTGLWVHPDHPWLAASPDRLVGDRGLLEVKCGKNLYPDLPKHVEVQAKIQLACTGRDWCTVWQYVGGRTQSWQVDRDGIAHLIEGLLLYKIKYLDNRLCPKRKEVKPWA
jgi:exodeoxyribonuclease (lambda-induced)